MNNRLADKGLVRLSNSTINDITLNHAAIQAGKGRKLDNIYSVTWFLPIVTHALKGGVRTIFTFAEELSKKWGCINNFVIYSHSGHDFDVNLITQSLRLHFPGLRFVIRKFLNGKDSTDTLPGSEIAFCTLWTTAYLLLKYNRVLKKFYFMQDYEPLFYEAGSTYAVIEQTYRFGFSCIANTPGVGNKYLLYSNDLVNFIPGVDKTIFFPETIKKTSITPYRVVFYGRPGNPRNCFTLGVLILQALKRKLKDYVQIISVGADWNVKEYGLEGVVENWGLLGSLKEVADLYRSSDIGLVFMVTPHPSYQPLEYMACGCVVATNINEANTWLLNDTNSLQLEPIPEIAAQRMHDLLKDENRKAELVKQGLDAVESMSWYVAYKVFENRLLN